MSDESDAVDIEIEDADNASETRSETRDTEGDASPDADTQGSSEAEAATESGATESTETTENEATSEKETATEPDETTIDSVVDRLESVDDELATVVRDRFETLRTERDEAHDRADELEDKLKRTQADFQNYKKRAKKRQRSIQDRATEDLVERLVPIRDNLQRALDQDEGADIREGVESTLTELDRVLEEENVELIEPEPGEDVDPHRHEVLMRVDSDQPAETIAEHYRPGYEMGDKVLREAQVTVSDGDGDQ